MTDLYKNRYLKVLKELFGIAKLVENTTNINFYLAHGDEYYLRFDYIHKVHSSRYCNLDFHNILGEFLKTEYKDMNFNIRVKTLTGYTQIGIEVETHEEL